MKQVIAILTLMLAPLGGGCHWINSRYEALRGDGFPEWSQNMNESPRGNADDSRPSGYFTDRRSDQIEKNLGGGF